MSVPQRPAEQIDPVAEGWAALTHGGWELARDRFETALRAETTPEALEGLGTAAAWLDDPRTIEIRERAYRLFRDRGNPAGAARVAVALALDHLTFVAEEAVARGWLELAGHLLADLRVTQEHGLLALWEAHFAVAAEHDPVKGARLAARAIEVGRTVGDADLELLGLALEGAALVAQGRVADGMRRLDASVAAAVAGEIGDIASAGHAYGYLVLACEQVRDLPRAAQWGEKLDAYWERVGSRAPLKACHAHHASVLVERGDWARAEAEMIAVAERLRTRRPALAVEGVVRLAELRRRQGRLAEAADLFAAADPHPLATLGRAALALDEGDPAAAIAGAQRYLRQLPETERTSRAGGLELLVHAKATLAEVESARDELAELRELAASIGTGPLRAAAGLAEADLLLAGRNAKAARRVAEDAVDAYERAGAPFGAARARSLLARILGTLGQTSLAQREAQVATRAFDHLGAAREAEAVRQLFPGAAPTRPPLTRREREVLWLVARGGNNAEIAGELGLSEHTVHRHVANVLGKLGVPTRAAAVARAAGLGLFDDLFDRELARSGHPLPSRKMAQPWEAGPADRP